MIKTVQYPYTIKNIRLKDGCNIAYIDEGTGLKTLVFIHGLANYALSWRKNIDYLKKYYRCIAIDLPGNGFSDRGDYPYSIKYFSEAVYQLIGQLQLTDVCLVGHSMGGQIAITTLLNHPTCASKLILCSPAGFETFSATEKTMYQSSVYFFGLFSTDENSLRKTIRSGFYHFPVHAEEMIDELVNIMKAYPSGVHQRIIEKCIHGMLNEPVFDSLHLVKQKTLVMFGERDALIPNRLIHMATTMATAKNGVSKMPNASLKMIPQCGHFLQLEKAPEVNALMHNFLDKT